MPEHGLRLSSRVGGRAGRGPARPSGWGRIRGAALAAATLLLLAFPGTASAHPTLLQTSPAPGLIAPKAPHQIELSFSEAAVPAGSRITLSKLGGAPVPVGNLRSVSGGRTLSVAPEASLPEGTYQVTWTALGDDGHLVSGRFAFGVAGAHGQAPPGAQAIVAFGSRGGGGGDQSTGFEGGFTVLARWLGLLAASLLVGGAALMYRLRGALLESEQSRARARWRLAARYAWLLMLLTAVEEVIASATAGAGGGIDLRAMFTSPTGQGDVVQLGLLAIASIALFALGWARRDRNRPLGGGDAIVAVGGLVVLIAQGLTGHV